ncbi:glycosyltransferase [Candidatus Amesbacteria bacterium]|nr:glycosyltransferase [Candidatus Amesbacteria bacterium]
MAKIDLILPHHHWNTLGAGLSHKDNVYITHSTLPHHLSAHTTLIYWQKLFLLFLFLLFVNGLVMSPWATAIAFVALLTAVYFADALFNFVLILKSLHFPPEISIPPDQLINKLTDQLPVYSILCPLYHEARVLPQFVEAISALDWPKDKLDVLLLLEKDDTATIEAAQNLNLFSYFRILIIPPSLPKTKPKACNYGLNYVTGEYTVIYDAEDRPEPDQLKKAYLAFQKVPAKVACLQSKLNYYNPRHNLLTRLFTAEYSLWFDVLLPGLQSINTTIPLGGTSNHFRSDVLKKLHGWDAFNVTEDCDIGCRLFKAGFTTAIINSTTYEEANSQLGNWIRQRSRWIKGYLQTFLVHNRHPLQFVRNHGWHALIFQLIVGGKIAFMLINPILWIMTFAYFALYRFVGPAIESIYPAPVFYMAAFSAVFGNFLYLYYYMIGCAKRGAWDLIKYVFLIPLYWLFISIAGFKALFQLIVRPHYWEKTHHGFHLQFKENVFKSKTRLVLPDFGGVWQKFSPPSGKLLEIGSLLLIASSFIGSVFDFLYNAYLGRQLEISDFGLITLIGTILFITRIPMNSLSRTITHKSAFYLGRHQTAIREFWQHIRFRTLNISLVGTAAWVIAIPFLQTYFKSPTLIPFMIFTPVWIIGALSAVDSGYLSGNLKFSQLASLAVVFSAAKFFLSIIFVKTGFPQYVYASTPAAMTLTFFMGWMFSVSIKSDTLKIDRSSVLSFPTKFFVGSVIIKLSEIAFYTMDIILAKHFLSPIEAGQYSLISLVGKMIFFIGGLFSQFILPFVSHDQGTKKDPRATFYRLLFASTLVSLAAFVGVGLFGYITTPILFGDKIRPVIYLLPTYGFAMFCFQVADNIISYHQARDKYFFAILALILSVGQVVGISLFHGSLNEIVSVMSVVGVANLVFMLFFHLCYDSLIQFYRDLHLLVTEKLKGFNKLPKNNQPSILIFNWRDTKHIWAGGAEVYLHEMAKRWVKIGHEVTLFCGSDGHCPRNETIDGINIIRRGGQFTVYIWAFLYYLLKLRGHFDVIVDSENGIPFFTPLFTRLPVFLLIHHVHQDLFRSNLYFPMDKIAMFLEGWLMPLVYRNSKIITVSESSRKDILSLGFFKSRNISVVNPGIDPALFYPTPKTRYPSFVYLGRIRAQKNIDVAIRAFAKVSRKYPSARFYIAGWGDKLDELAKLAKSLKLSKSVKFLGKVSDKGKVNLLARSWAMLQPSSFEGWGITVIEANACGTPVIASDVPGLRDSVLHDESGLLVPVKNEFALAEAMKMFIVLPDYRARLSSNALAWSTNFNWDTKSQDFLRTFTAYDKESKLNISVREAAPAYAEAQTL